MALIEETLSEGLKREFIVTVPKTDMDASFERKLRDLAKKVRIDGFRQGKVPLPVVKKRYGDSVAAELIEKTVSEQVMKLLKDRNLNPAAQPGVGVKSVYSPAEGGDLSFSVSLEVMPEIPEYDLSGVVLNNYVLPVEDSLIDEEIARIKERHGKFNDTEDGRVAAEGDKVIIDFTGYMDDEAFEGGSAKGFGLVLGKGNFIDGFEEGLIGAVKGETRTLNLTFPEQYHAKAFAGKDVRFEATVTDIKEFAAAEFGDELFNTLEVKDEAELRKNIAEGVERSNKQTVRSRQKQELFDRLEEICTFPIPERMSDGEFRQLKESVKQSDEDPGDDLKKNEELRRIADRRVRLGLYLAELGEKKGVEVTNEDLTKELYQVAYAMGVQPQQLFNYYRQNQEGLQALKGRALEEKVVDYLFETLTKKDVPISREDFRQLIEAEEEEGDEGEASAQEEAKTPKKAGKGKKAAE